MDHWHASMSQCWGGKCRIRTLANPPLAKRVLHCSSVRSMPPAWTNNNKSISGDMSLYELSLPSVTEGMIGSYISSFPLLFDSAFLQFRRILRHVSSSKRCIVCCTKTIQFRVQFSAPLLTRMGKNLCVCFLCGRFVKLTILLKRVLNFILTGDMNVIPKWY